MKVLFVCTGNTCRSPIAEALLKKVKPEIEVDSAGTSAYWKIVEVTKNYLEKETAIQHLKRVPEGLDTKELAEYDLIVAMEPRHKHVISDMCPECKDKIVVWNIEDPYFLPTPSMEKIFKRIRDKVEELARSL